MNRKEYQNAFSRLEPSQEVIDAVLARKEARTRHRGVRAGTVLLAAALTVAVLAGSAFAGVRFGWFGLGGAESVVQPERSDPEAFGKEDTQPAPQNLLKLDGEASDTWIGFTLPSSYRDGQDTRNCWMLGDGLYRRYYRNPDPSDPTSPLLTVEIVYDATYMTRYASEVVKEGALNGMQTVWLRLDGSADGRAHYCLFQRNDALGCFAVIASTEGFAEAEQAAMDMRCEDTGISIAQAEDEVWYGFRLGWTPEDMTLDSREVMADRWYMANATLRDESLDLSELLLGGCFISTGEKSYNIGITIIEGLAEIAPMDYGTPIKRGTIGGHTAYWVQGCGGSSVFIQVKYPEEQVQLLVQVVCYGADPETGDTVELLPEDRFVEIAEQILASAELVPVAVASPAPADFVPFSVG